MTSHEVAAADGTRLHYTVEGDGPVDFLLCDGLGCDGFIWRYLRPALQAMGRIIHLHMRGHGLSGRPVSPGRIEMSQLADDWMPVIEATGSRTAIVLGHSMGVQVALELWHRHPRHVAALVLVCGSFENPTATFHEGRGLARMLPLLQHATRFGGTTLKRLWRRLVALPVAYHVARVGEIHPDLMKRRDFQAYVDHLAQMDPEVFVRTLAGAAAHSAGPYLEAIDVPVLIIGGALDTFTPGRLSEEMRARIPGARALVVDEGTHTVPLEHSMLVNLEVARFAEQVIASESAVAVAG